MGDKFSNPSLQTLSDKVEAGKQSFYPNITECAECCSFKIGTNRFGGFNPSACCSANILQLKNMNRSSISYVLSTAVAFNDMWALISSRQK
jgi:hypothetical protein